MMCCQYLLCIQQAHPGCLNEMDLSASLWCRTVGLIELRIPPPWLLSPTGVHN